MRRVPDRDRSSPRSASAASDARGGARPARRAALRPRRGPRSSARPRQPGARARRSACTRTTTCSATAAARRSSAELAADREHLRQVEALDPAGLSPRRRFERDLELHNVRRAIFDADVLRIWERRSFALDTLGDGLFLLFARDHAPLPSGSTRSPGGSRRRPTYLEEAKTRATVPQVRRWQQIEIETADGAAGLLRRARRGRRG